MFKLEFQPESVAANFPQEKAVEFLQAVNYKPLKYFVPTGKQEEFIQTVAKSTEDSTMPVVALAAANGIGKTTTAITTVLNIIYGAQTGWYDYPLFHSWPFPKLCWYCSTADALRDKIIPLFEKLALPGTMESSKDGKTFTAKMTFPKYDWTISFKTYEQEPSTFESADVGLLILDEPAPLSIWNACKSRLRLGGITLIPMTPLFTPPYLYDEVKKSYEKGIKGYHYIEADVYSACQRRGIRGYLKPNTVDEWVQKCDPQEVDARIYGRFAYFSQLIYPDLDFKKHYVEPSDYPIPDYALIKQIVDPHDTRPPACIYAALCPNKRIIIFAETPVQNNMPFWEMRHSTTIRDDIESWLAMEKSWPEKLRNLDKIRIMDRHFGWQMRGKRTFAEMYYEEGRRINPPVEIDFDKSYEVEGNVEGEIHYGHKEVRRMLLPLEDGKPGLVIWKNCYHTWNGLTHYVRKHEITTLAMEKAAQSGRIIEKYKDFCDLVRYLVCDDNVPEIPAVPKTRYEREMEKVYREVEHDKDWLYE